LFLNLKGPKVFNIDDGCPVDGIFRPSKHFTMIFNAFVLMNLFNGINSRKIHGEKNVFDGIFQNRHFCVVWIFTFIGQIILVQYGSYIFSCVALTFGQWIWCLLFALAVLPWNQVTTFYFTFL
jgi:Ca2+ transporting ATPase